MMIRASEPPMKDASVVCCELIREAIEALRFLHTNRTRELASFDTKSIYRSGKYVNTKSINTLKLKRRARFYAWSQEELAAAAHVSAFQQ